jgi:cytochrome c-type biogenesis protein CcmH/NrfF
MRTGLAVLLGAAALFAPAGAALAAAPRTTLPDVEDEVMCPVCGTPLNEAQAPQAQRERTLIRALVAQGKTKDEIKHRLVEEYGPGVLAMPPPKGFSLAAHLVPLALGLAALALLAFAVARWRRPRRSAQVEPAPLSAADARRLDEDLARYDG